VWDEAALQAMTRDARDKLLLMSYCEDQMKLKYSQFVATIDVSTPCTTGGNGGRGVVKVFVK